MNNAPIVFAGPSLPPEDRPIFADLTFKPPAEAGDVLSLLRNPPAAICIIDGYFDDRMAVLHKEILHALSLGVKVYGAGSIGALRAAELETYGMIGVGKVFRAYRDGDCDCDDAVAVTHGPAEAGYPLLSVAQVDVIATADSLLRRRRISRAERKALIAASQEIHFAYRTWAKIQQALGRPALATLLEQSHVEQKRLDALEALRRVQREFEAGRRGYRTGFAPPATPAYRKQVALHCPEIA